MELWKADPANCCSAAKVEQLDRALVGKLAWMSGLRRAEAPTRATAPIVARDLRGLVKVNPIATWTDHDVAGYIADHDVPVNPLLDQGYPSIGCRPCTQPVGPTATIPARVAGPDRTRRSAACTSEHLDPGRQVGPDSLSVPGAGVPLPASNAKRLKLIPRSARRAAAVMTAAGVVAALLTAPGALGVPRPAASDRGHRPVHPAVPDHHDRTAHHHLDHRAARRRRRPDPGPRPRPCRGVPTPACRPCRWAVRRPPPRRPAPQPHRRPNPTPILAAVQSDLSQLTAINDYAQARAQVSSSQQAAALAAAALQSAMTTQSKARAAQQAAQTQVAQAGGRLRTLAVAAYMGLGYLTPAAGPQPPGQAAGTVNSPGGLSGTAAVDAQEMVRLVAQRDRRDVADTHRALLAAQHSTADAGQGVAQAQAAVATAESGLAASQQTLALVTRAATTPGLAAALNILDLPGQSTLPGATNPATGASPAGGLSALGAPDTAQPPTTQTATGPVNAAVAIPVAASPTILGPADP